MSTEGTKKAGANGSPFLAAVAYVLVGLLATALMGGAKFAFEHSSWGHDLELWVFGKLQGQLNSVDRENPIALIDISGLRGEKGEIAPLLCPKETGGNNGRKTAHCLEEIITALAEQRPRAIAVDMDFTPTPTGLANGDDGEFIDFCLDLKQKKNLPIFLAIGGTKAARPEQWLGAEEYKDLAVAVATNKQDTSRMPLWVQANGGEKLKTLSFALAKEYWKELPGPPNWIAGAVESNDARLQVESQSGAGTELAYASQPVNYSKLDAMALAAKSDTDAASIARSDRSYRNKLVIIGNVTRFVAPDAFIVPGHEEEPVGGIMLHACATYTLVKEPLFELSSRARLLLDLAIAGIIILGVAFTRYRHPEDLSWHSRQALYIYAAIVLVFLAGWLLVRTSGVMWLDFLLVMGALFLHPTLEGLLYKIGARFKKPSAEGRQPPQSEQHTLAAGPQPPPPQELEPAAQHEEVAKEVDATASAEPEQATTGATTGTVLKVGVLILAATLALASSTRAQGGADPSCQGRAAALVLKLNLNAKGRKGAKGKQGNCYFRENRNDTWHQLSAKDERRQFPAKHELYCDKGGSLMLWLCDTREQFEMSKGREKPYRVIHVFSPEPLRDPNPNDAFGQRSQLFIPDNPATADTSGEKMFYLAAPRMPRTQSYEAAARPARVPNSDVRNARSAIARAGENVSAPAVACAACLSKTAQDSSSARHAESSAPTVATAATPSTPAATSAAAEKTTSAATEAAVATETAATTAANTTRIGATTAASSASQPATAGAASPAAASADEAKLAMERMKAAEAFDESAANRLTSESDELRSALENGNTLRDKRQYAAAEHAYVEASLIGPDDARAYYGLGNVYSDQQNWEGAERAYRRAVTLNQSFDQAYLALAFTLTQQPAAAQRLTEAESLLWRAAELRPTDERTYELLGVVLEKRAADAPAFVTAYRRAVAINPRSAEVRLRLSAALRKAGASREADEQLQRAVELSRTPSQLVSVAEGLESARQYEKAEKLLRAALASEPHNPRALYALGRVLLLRKHFGEALEPLKAAAEATTAGFEPRFFLALTYLKERRPAEAEQSLEGAAAVLSPAGERARLALAYGFESTGDSYAEAGRLADAERAYKRALSFDPEDADTKNKLTALRARIKH
jgi:tetratricopeptide (TPR) repeat protein/CHASE2 domain-containing sensor protein